MPAPRSAFGAAVAGGRLYAPGGYNVTAQDRNEEYVPGVSRALTGLKPNTQYTFHAKAMNQAGSVGAESLPNISTYTLATVALMPDGNTF